MSTARLSRLATDIAARQHAISKLNAGPRRKGDLDTRLKLQAELRALERERDAEMALQSWIAPREEAHG